ncbi:MAG TPA: hypothetical protein VM537_24485 [Anaerolineae bacterium]|nr:hypothetical protein [Anaerolineae bacterium]
MAELIETLSKRIEFLEGLVEALEEAGDALAEALIEACKVLGEKNPRKTIPVLAVWDAVRKRRRQEKRKKHQNAL